MPLDLVLPLVALLLAVVAAFAVSVAVGVVLGRLSTPEPPVHVRRSTARAQRIEG